MLFVILWEARNEKRSLKLECINKKKYIITNGFMSHLICSSKDSHCMIYRVLIPPVTVSFISIQLKLCKSRPGHGNENTVQQQQLSKHCHNLRYAVDATGRQTNQLVSPNEKGCRGSVEHLDRLMMWR